VTEKLYFFIAEYDNTTQKTHGGGVEEEEIEVLEIPFAQAMDMVKSGEIMDGKTIMLLQYLQLSNIL
jgi:GDP-mannose pyrophosphatase NudK